MSSLLSGLASALDTRTAEEWSLVRAGFRGAHSGQQQQQQQQQRQGSSGKGGSVPAPLLSYAAFCQSLHFAATLLQFRSAGGIFKVAGRVSGWRSITCLNSWLNCC